MNLSIVNWIMGCIQSISFIVLISGYPSSFFRASRGLLQGCPMSPFPSLLMVEALRKLISNSRLRGELRGVKVSAQEFTSHLFFIDDVLCFVQGIQRDLTTLKEVLDLYCKATDMEINQEKTCLLACGIPENSLLWVDYLLRFPQKEMDAWLCTLNFFLNKMVIGLQIGCGYRKRWKCVFLGGSIDSFLMGGAQYC